MLHYLFVYFVTLSAASDGMMVHE